MSLLHNEMILASAGSGKTYQLTNRYIGLMALQLRAGQEVTPERIIAVTFTRKAAGEFFDSILEKLAEAAIDPDKAPAFSEENLLSQSVAGLGPEQFTQLLRVFVNRMPRLFLGTLDSFYSNVLRSFPSEFGLAGDFEIIDQHLESLARKDVYQTVFQRRFARDEDGDAAQREFLEAFRLATFGKEESRIRRELDQFVSDLHGLFLEAPSGKRWGNEKAIWPDGCPFLGSKTDLERDFDELFTLFRERDQSEEEKDALRPGDWEFWEEFRTEAPLHRPGAKLTKRIEYMFKNLLPHWEDLEASSATATVNRKKHTFTPKECTIVLRILRHLAGGEIENRLHRTHGVWQLLDRYESAYADRIRRQGKLTFQDLALLLAGSIDDGENSAPILSQIPGEDDRLRIDYRLDARYDHWLLDEFQDTSFLQWKVIANLIDEAVQDTSGERSLFQVGDIKQSIYAWRGGDPTLLRDIFRHYNQNEERIVRRNLDVSWRSGYDVIDPVNQVFGVPAVLEELSLPEATLERWEWSDHEVCPPNETMAGYTALLNPIPPGGEKAEEEDRFAIVVEILEEMQPIQRGIECAILVQTNKVGRRIVDYIRSHSDIPVMSEADVPIATDNALNRAVLSYLQMAAHPSDNFAWQHLRLTPFLEVIERDEMTPTKLSSQVRARIFEKGFERVVRDFIGALSSLPSLTLDEFSLRRGEDLALAARLFDEGGARNIDEFLSYARNRTVREPDAKSAVQVMTIHKSKGLTFDAVLLPDLEGKALTTARNDIGAKKNSRREVEWVYDLPKKEIYQADKTLQAFHEEREADAAYENLCKLYVAMTRARCANYFITQPRGSSSKSNNFVKMLETALVAGDAKDDQIGDCPVSILFETELPTSHRKWFEQRSLSPVTESAPGEIAPTPSPDLARFRPKRRTPSGSESAVVTAAQIFSQGSSEARDFGNLVHAIFEDIEWAGTTTSDSLRSSWQDRPDVAPETTQAALAQVQQCLESKPILAALSRPSENAVAWREKSFEILLDDEWLSGVFDRVVIDRDTSGAVTSATILDYKTDRLGSDEDIENAVKKYEPQLAIYRRVLARMLAIQEDRVGTNLLFTRLPRLVEL